MAAAEKTQDAIALLTDDHRRMEALFADHDKARGAALKRRLVVAVCTELTLHAIVEEELLYPACRSMLGPELAAEIDDDREEAAALVADLLGASPDSERYEAMVRAVRAHLAHHVRAEEGPGGLFERLRESGMDLVHLGRRMRARRRDLLGDLELVGLIASEERSFRGAGGSDASSETDERAGEHPRREPRILM